jgi:hypothetical protein
MFSDRKLISSGDEVRKRIGGIVHAGTIAKRLHDYIRCRKSPPDEFRNIFMGHFTLRDLKIVDSG